MPSSTTSSEAVSSPVVSTSSYIPTLASSVGFEKCCRRQSPENAIVSRLFERLSHCREFLVGSCHEPAQRDVRA
jgi:hypothetical protein